jgi:alanyl-tRNA synthetase
VDLTADVAREKNLEVDQEGFEAAMEEQRRRGRAAQKFDASLTQRIHTEGKAEFTGYTEIDGESRVVGVFDADGQPVDALIGGGGGVVVLDRTPFYGESGGQIGDTGTLTAGDAVFDVSDTQIAGDQYLHVGSLRSGVLKAGDRVTAAIDGERRQLIRLNHSATHLMHAALRNVLGDHVQQKGSLVAPERLRFDFSHPEPVTREELKIVERIVNDQILANTAVDVSVMSYDEAIEHGAMALFGEKYGNEVRVLTMGDGFSVELCGGTHVSRTGDIGLFRIVSESGIAAGVRRIEAVTGPAALDYVEASEAMLASLAALVKGSRSEVVEKVTGLIDENRRLNRDLEQARQKLAASQGTDLAGASVDVGGISVLATKVDGDSKTLMQTLDALRSKLGTSVIVLGNVDGDRVGLIAGVSKDLTDRIKAPEVINAVGVQVGARGGGRPDMARAGGGDRPEALDEALSSVSDWVRDRLAAD